MINILWVFSWSHNHSLTIQILGYLCQTVLHVLKDGSDYLKLCLIFLVRNGALQRRNSWQDGVYGTNCPIPPGKNYTYVLQVKDQIGSYFYFPSLGLHKAAGGYGGFKIVSRPLIPVPFDPPSGDITILAGDWYKSSHRVKFLVWIIVSSPCIPCPRTNKLSINMNLYIFAGFDGNFRQWKESSLPWRTYHQWW